MSRTACAVPFCGRTTRDDTPNWLCSNHWPLVRRDLKAGFRRACRKLEAAPEGPERRRWNHAAWRWWDRCVRCAIERAAGLK